MRILITGANGFVGRAIVARLEHEGIYECRRLVRRSSGAFRGSAGEYLIGDITDSLIAPEAFVGADVLIHTAARVHIMNDQSEDALAEFRRVNVEGTLNLARKAASAGIRRFIFVSSIKVNGEQTFGLPFNAANSPAPVDPYGISKHEAETALFKLAKETGMELVVIRPPLVYGPGVRANFKKLIQWVDWGVPLPFGRINNQRSLVALDNLVDFILACVKHPKAKNQVFLVSDGQDLSTADLVREIAKAFGRSAFLLPIPKVLLLGFAGLLGKRDVARRVLGSLQVDISKNEALIGWRPKLNMQEQLRQTIEFYRHEKVV